MPCPQGLASLMGDVTFFLFEILYVCVLMCFPGLNWYCSMLPPVAKCLSCKHMQMVVASPPSWLRNILCVICFSSNNVGMDQYLLIPFLVGWKSILTQLFWGSPGVQGFDTYPCQTWWFFWSRSQLSTCCCLNLPLLLKCPGLHHLPWDFQQEMRVENGTWRAGKSPTKWRF